MQITLKFEDTYLSNSANDHYKQKCTKLEAYLRSFGKGCNLDILAQMGPGNEQDTL